MVLHDLHRERIGDHKHAERLGPLAGRRGKHLGKLKPVEDLLHAKAPLPASFDVSRGQPPYFNEFSYTECLGLLMVQPQSSEIAARLVAFAAEAENPFSEFDVSAKIANCDKYLLDDGAPAELDAVAFPTGSNIFDMCVSREAMDRAMHRDPGLMIKLHPITSPGLIERLGVLYGYHRLIGPTVSGWACLNRASTIYTTTSSEMGLYGFLIGKPVLNITAYGFEAQGSYNSYYRLLWELSPEDATATLKRVLNSPYSGLFHPDDPNLEAKMEHYFAKAMELREQFKPLVYEYEPRDYAQLVNHQLRKRPQHAPSPRQREQRSHPVAGMGQGHPQPIPDHQPPRPYRG